jgi:Protein of unknown function (DUF3263).
MLSSEDLSLLAFEKANTRNTPAKVERIRDTFGLSAARYYQRLHRIIDNPHALEAEPMLVRRLLRLRAVRGAVRTVRDTRI